MATLHESQSMLPELYRGMAKHSIALTLNASGYCTGFQVRLNRHLWLALEASQTSDIQAAQVFHRAVSMDCQWITYKASDTRRPLYRLASALTPRALSRGIAVVAM